MARSINREVKFTFASDVRDLERGTREIATGIDRANEKLGVTEALFENVRTAAVNAGATALIMARDWAIAGIEIADSADDINKSFENTFGTSGQDGINKNIEASAKHLGLADFEARKLHVTAGLLAQSMGSTKDESAEFASELFDMAGDLSTFLPFVGDTEDAMSDLEGAIGGNLKGLQDWGISISTQEVRARALKDTNKKSVAALTDLDKANATTALIIEKMAETSYGALSQAIDDNATKQEQLIAVETEQQRKMGEVGQVIKNVMIQALYNEITALENVGTAIGESLVKWDRWSKGATGFIGAVSRALLDLALFLTGAAPTRFLDRIKDAARNTSRALEKVASFAGRGLLNAFSFHSGGTVPGAKGTSQPIIAQGGETVGRPNAGDGGGPVAQTVINVNVQTGLANPQETAREIVDLLQVYNRTEGLINIELVEQ